MNVIEDHDGDIVARPVDLSEYINSATFEPDLHWNYAVRDLMRRGEVSLLYAASNVGKSALAGLLASSVAAGVPFFGRATRRGIAVHVAAEAPISIAERSRAYRDVCAAGAAAPYQIRRSAVDLGNPKSISTFMKELRLMEEHYCEDLVLVIVDTLVLSIGDLDENVTSDMTVVTEAAKRIATSFDTHVCLVHHSGKDTERGARGASSIRGAVDTEIELRLSSDGTTVLARNTKQRTLARDADFAFRIEPFTLGADEDGRVRTTAKAVPVPAPSGPGKGAQDKAGAFDRRTAILTVLHGFRKSDRTDFATSDVLAALPPEALAGVNSEDSRRKAVARALTNIAEAASAPIKAAPRGWTWT